jgi:hypothetical protein
MIYLHHEISLVISVMKRVKKYAVSWPIVVIVRTAALMRP